ncbi:Uncharacterised protein [Mycobacterium tuberculosis]|nr:Uncharacterised protein [Mycobacterium tuberculosis]
MTAADGTEAGPVAAPVALAAVLHAVALAVPERPSAARPTGRAPSA